MCIHSPNIHVVGIFAALSIVSNFERATLSKTVPRNLHVIDAGAI
jgi:hypothetical protein